MHEPPSNVPSEPSRSQRVAALCWRFEQRWQQGERPHIEEFLAEVQPGARSLLLEELLQVEWRLRQERGQAVRFEPYASRFADEEELVRAAWLRWLGRSTGSGSLDTPATVAPAGSWCRAGT
jgi:hypothetical protein